MRATIAITVLLLTFLIGAAALYTNTGFLQGAAIDDLDKHYWRFENGVIKGAEEYTLKGSNETCWVMVHGYESTPAELRSVAEAVNKRFNDTVYVPRLKGHGQLPSDVEKYTVDDWFAQIEQLAQEKNCSYILGSSMGASLALRYSQLHPVEGVVVSGVPLRMEPSYLPTGEIVKVVAPSVNYLKRKSPGESVEDPEGKRTHITNWVFPLQPVAQVYEFNKAIWSDLGGIQGPVLFIHGTRDKTSGLGAARDAYDQVPSPKAFIELQCSHIIFKDHCKEDAIDAVFRLRSGELTASQFK